MNIGYVFDLNGIFSDEDQHIPFLNDIYCFKYDVADLNASEVLKVRDNVMAKVHKAVGKHLFFFVLNYDKEALSALSKCISGIQDDTQYFSAANNEVHVVCNFMNDKLFNAKDYEKAMPCLTNNSVCVYSWFLGQYNHNSDRLIRDKRRAHAIMRLVSMVSNQEEVSKVLMPIAQTSSQPIYNLFGDASVFFDEEGRTQPVRNYYYYKSIQHLLNLPDNKLDEYIKYNVIPFKNDKNELEKRIEATSDDFLKKQRGCIEASLITEKTQSLLLKTSDDDEEYLVNATDNKLVFLDNLAKTQSWQLEQMESFLIEYQGRVDKEDVQVPISDGFLEELYDKRYIIHKRESFPKINNVVSESSKAFVEKFKTILDKHLHGYLDQHNDESYGSLHEILTEQETKSHRSNLDYGIAFMEYLESGKSEYLTDLEVSMGDINFKTINEALVEEESRRHQEYEAKKKEIEEKYTAKDKSQPSKIKESFNEKDEHIMQCYKEKKHCDYDIQYLIDDDSEKKLTSTARALIAFGSGILAAIVWLVISNKLLSKIFEHYGKFQWRIFFLLVLAGLAVGSVIFIKAWLRRRAAMKALEEARELKKIFMNDCVTEINDLTKLHYNYLLAYHGLKSMSELVDYVAWKKEDVINFKKTMFKLMCQYRIATIDDHRVEWDDDNTIELFDDMDVKTLLFGTENQKNNIPYCFAQNDIVLSDTFIEFKRKKARWETSRHSLDYSNTSQNFDQAALENEVIPCMSTHQNIGIEYTQLKEASILPADVSGIEMDDVHQGYCGDCYFMATLAAIAKTRPDYIIGKNGMVEELGTDHRFFRVKFYNKDKDRVNVDVDNRFWNQNGTPYYAGKGKSNNTEGTSYNPWVMAVEKAWAKANGHGYDGIVGASGSGREYVRKVEYSYAVTGRSAFYCNIRNVSDNAKLLEMIKKHFCKDGLPITLYSVNESESKLADPNIVLYHAYALQEIHDDNTFDIFNPWNNHEADEYIKGKHYRNVDIQFIKDNFGVLVFFGIEEANFNSFERELTNNAAEDVVTKGIEKILKDSFVNLELPMRQIQDLLTEEGKELLLNYSEYLFNNNNVNDPRGVEGSAPLLFMEGINSNDNDETNNAMMDYLEQQLPGNITLQPLLHRDDDKQCFTLFRLSPHYVLESFR